MSTVRKDMDIRGADSKSRFHNDWSRDFLWFFRKMCGCFPYGFNGRTEMVHSTKT